MSIPSAHPPDDRLFAFGLGQLDPDSAASVERHVEDCEPCATLLNVLPSDEFLTALRDAASPTAEAVTRRRIEETPGPVPSRAARASPALPPELEGHPRYRVVELLGSGGMGAVYRADHTLMDRPVALKVMNGELFQNDEALARFRQEVRAAGRLQHPNIVAAYDADQAGSLTFLVMEYVEGQSLAEVLKARGPLPATLACQYVRQAALGLQHAHEKGMVHRDIKPHNLMLTTSGEVKVLDFGLARFVCEQGIEPEPSASEAGNGATPASPSLTQTGTVMGTIDYIAPEQARDSRRADVRADIYGLGCTLYHCLTGRVPYPGGDVTSKLTRLLVEDPVPLDRLRPDAPKGLSAVVGRMMAKKHENRYQTPAEVVTALAPFARVEPRRRRAGLLVVVALLVLAGAVFALRGGTKSVEVPVETDAPDTEIFADAAGAIVRVRDRLSGANWAPEPGRYPLAEADGPGGLTLELDESTRLTLRRTGDSLQARWNEATVVQVSVLPNHLRGFGHGAPIAHGLAVSPDGLFAVSAGGLEYLGDRLWKSSPDADLRLWDLEGGREVRRLSGHTGHIGCVAFSPDGRRVAGAASHEQSVRVWDVRSGTPIHTLKGHNGHVLGVAYSPDGRRLLSASWDRTLRLWDAMSGNELLRFGEGLTDWGRVAFSPDGRFAAAAGLERISWFDVTTGAEVHRFIAADRKLGRVVGLAVSPDGRLVLSASAESPDHAIRLWDAATGKLVRTLGHHAGFAHGVAFTPDGKRAVSTGQDGTVRVWSVADGVEQFRGPTGPPAVSLTVTLDGRCALAGCVDKIIRVVRLDEANPPTNVGEVRQMLGHGSDVRAVTVSPDGRVGYSVGWDRTLRVWDLTTGQERRRVGERTNPVEGLSLSADGSRLLVGHYSDPVRLWDAESGKELLAMKGHTGGIHAIAIAPDGLRGLAGGADHTVRLWDLKKGKLLQTFSGHSGVVSALAFCTDGRRALSGSHDNTMRLWDLETGHELKKFEGFANWVLDVAVSPDGRHALSNGGPGNTARLWDLDTGQEVRRFTGHTLQVHSVAFSSDGTRAITGAFDGTVRYWDVPSGAMLTGFMGHIGYVTSVKFCRDDTHFLSGGQDGTVRLWRLPDVPLTVLPRHIPVAGAHVLSVAFTPDGTRLVAGADRDEVYQLDFTTGKQSGTIGKCGWSSAVTVSPDGKLAASGHANNDKLPGVVRVFEVGTGRVVHRLSGHPDETDAVAFSPDGARLATGGGDRCARLWDVGTGKCVRTFEGHTQRIYQIAFSHDGKHLVSADGDAVVRLWDVQSGKLIRTFPGALTVAVLPDGKHLLTGDRDEAGTVRLWKFDGQQPERLWRIGAPVGWLCVSPDGSQLLATHHEQRRLTLWDVRSGRQRLHCLDLEWKPNRAVFSPDGKSVAAGGFRGGIIVWNLASTAMPPATVADTGFRETHGAAESELRQWIYRVGREGFRLVSVSACAGSPQPRFNGLAVRDGRNFATDFQLLSGTEPNNHFHKMSRIGFRPLVSCLYADGGKQKQAHLWVADGVGFSGFGTTFARLPTLLEDEGRKKRMMPIYLSSEPQTKPGEELTVIMAPDGGVAWEVKSGLTAEELRALTVASRSRGWRLTHLNAYASGDGPRFVAVIAENPTKLEWDCRTGLTVREYEKGLESVERMHPIAVGSYLDGNEVRYAAVWAVPVAVKPPAPPSP